MNHRLIGLGLAAFKITRLHKLLAPLTRGRGAILTFHRVQPDEARAFAPNRFLEVTPAFLDAVLRHVRQRGYDIVPLDTVPRLLAEPARRPFVALTFDDGYRDTLEQALPILDKHAAPFTVYVTTGFADRTARLWWIELETAIRHRTTISCEIAGQAVRLSVESDREKQGAFVHLTGLLRHEPDDRRLQIIGDLATGTSMIGPVLTDHLCMPWLDIERLAGHPLATIGCHTLTHPTLSRLSRPALLDELAGSRDALARRLGRPIDHFAYPYGGPLEAGAREFEAARDLGFRTAVTTRPGVLNSRSTSDLTALPRLSMNGLWQDLAMTDVLLSGTAAVLLNAGRAAR